MNRKQKQQLVDALNNYFNKNPQMLIPGTRMSWKRFRQRFSKFFPNLTSSPHTGKGAYMPYLDAYNNINKVLAASGIYMKSKDYYSEFIISENVPAKINNYKRHSDALLSRQSTLAAGHASASGKIQNLPTTAKAAIAKTIAPCVPRCTW